MEPSSQILSLWASVASEKTISRQKLELNDTQPDPHAGKVQLEISGITPPYLDIYTFDLFMTSSKTVLHFIGWVFLPEDRKK